MTRNLKTLGLAFLAILATSAIASSAAHAAPGELHSEVGGGKTTAILTGSSLGKFQGGFKALPFECQGGSFEGKVQKTTTDATITPQFTGCKLGALTAQVKMNGCQFTLTGVADFTANVDVALCTTGKPIEIISSFCTVKVFEQKNLTHVVFTNTAGPPKKDIDASLTLSGVTYEAVAKFSGGCMDAPGHHADGILTGNTTVRAYEDEGLNQLVTVNDHCYQPFKDGAQIDLFST